MASCIQGWPQTVDVAEGCECSILLPPHSKCWDDRRAPPLACVVLGVEAGTACACWAGTIPELHLQPDSFPLSPHPSPFLSSHLLSLEYSRYLKGLLTESGTVHGPHLAGLCHAGALQQTALGRVLPRHTQPYILLLRSHSLHCLAATTGAALGHTLPHD